MADGLSRRSLFGVAAGAAAVAVVPATVTESPAEQNAAVRAAMPAATVRDATGRIPHNIDLVRYRQAFIEQFESNNSTLRTIGVE
jgi:hypothetical protein